MGLAPRPAHPPDLNSRRLTIVRGDSDAAFTPRAPRAGHCHIECERTPEGGVAFVGHTSDGRTPVRAAVDLAHDDWLGIAARVADLLDVYEAAPGIALAKG